MSTNWPRSELEIVALAYIASHDEPVGSQRLQQVLAEAGFAMAEATAGRFLRALDQQGFTEAVQNTRGRVITAAGEERLAELLRERRRALLSAELVEAVSAADLQSALDLLYVRRAIEPEGVHHAALKATDAEIEAIARLAEDHVHDVAGSDSVGPAMNFHRSLAEASHNGVLAAVAALLLDPVNDRLAHLQRQISSDIGTTRAYVNAHQQIAGHLRARDAHAAERAMRDHIDQMIAAVKAYQAAREGQGNVPAMRDGNPDSAHQTTESQHSTNQ